ncbi:MAG: monovalent cation/H+ antiporter subunit D family protein [Panacagrimonas sp.]
MIAQQLPALQVVVPLICAPLCVVFGSRQLAWALFLLASLSSLGCAIWMSALVLDGQVLRYAMGGWPAPQGIEYVVDGANAPILLLLSLVAVLGAVYAWRSVAQEIEPRRADLFYACLCLCLCGLLGITTTGDAFNVFVFLEISSLSSYALIAMGRHRRALLSAFQYLIMGTVGGTFLLLGIGLAYGLTGTLNMADLAQRLPELYGNRALTAAVLFVFVGMAIKAAVFPLHAWLPGAYGEAPSVVSLFLSATGTKVALYVLIRFCFTVFGAALVFQQLPLHQIGLLLSCAAMLVGAAAACFQTDFRRLLAWSSVGQIGYIFAGICLANADGLSAAYLHLINHGVIKATLFAAAGLLLLRMGSTRLEDMAGLARRMPWTFGAILLTGLGLIGVPLTAGFVSKWALALALIEQSQWLVLISVLLSSLLALGYVGHVIEVCWFRDPPSDVSLKSGSASMTAVTWVLALLSIYLGIDASLTSALADAAAQALTGAAS